MNVSAEIVAFQKLVDVSTENAVFLTSKSTVGLAVPIPTLLFAPSILIISVL